MPTTVVNVRNAEPGTYVYCGRPTVFGNPFWIGKDGTRTDVIGKYIDYFFDRMQRDPLFRQKIHRLKNKQLGCWCAPELCHCSVIAEYLNTHVTA